VITGPNLALLIVGLACTAAGVATIWETLTGGVIDWAQVGPIVAAAVGALLVLTGIIGVVGKARRDRIQAIQAREAQRESGSTLPGAVASGSTLPGAVASGAALSGAPVTGTAWAASPPESPQQ